MLRQVVCVGAEFFGFFGFVGRTSAVFGPTLYLLVTGIYDTRAAILAILIIIAVGSVLLQRVDTEEGRAVAREQDRLAFEVGCAKALVQSK